MQDLIRSGLLVLVLGCGSVPPEPLPGEPRDGASSQPAAAASPVSAASLGAARLDAHRVVFPSLVAEAGRRSLPDATRVTQALQDLDGPGAVELKTLENGALDGRVGRKEVRTYPDRGLIVIRDDRGDDAIVSVIPEESELLARARPVLGALGVDESEMIWKIAGTGKITAEPGKAPGAPQRTATKLYIERTVAGLPVAEEKLVVSFALDGSLRGVVGRWRPLDGRIGMQRTWTKPEVVERALSVLDQRGRTRVQTLDPTQPIGVETRLAPRHVAGGIWTLALVGQVSVALTGPGNARKPLQLDFDL